MDMIVIKNLGDCPQIIDYFVSTSNVIFLYAHISNLANFQKISHSFVDWQRIKEWSITKSAHLKILTCFTKNSPSLSIFNQN